MKRLINILLVLTLLVMTAFLGACSMSGETENQNDTNSLQVSDEADITSNQNGDVEEIVFMTSTVGSLVYPTDLEGMYVCADLVAVVTFKEHLYTFVNASGGIYIISAFNVVEVVKGDFDGKVVNILNDGGKVMLEEYRNALHPSQQQSRGHYDLSEEEVKNAYVEYYYWEAPKPRFEEEDVGQRYMLFVRDLPSYEEHMGAYSYTREGDAFPVFGSSLSRLIVDNADYLALGPGGYSILKINEHNQVYSYNKIYTSGILNDLDLLERAYFLKELNISDEGYDVYESVSFWEAGIPRAKTELEFAEYNLELMRANVALNYYPSWSVTKAESAEELMRLGINLGIYPSSWFTLLFDDE